jgi:group I intron endonuclease
MVCDMIVYKIKNIVNDKAYIGQTTRSVEVRWKEHKNDKRACRALFRAICKYGAENFTVYVLCQCNSIEELNEKEKFYINELNSIVPNGYNLRTGGLNSLMSDDSKNKMSISHLGEKNFNFGKHKSEETKNKISVANLGKKRSQSFKNNRSRYMRLNNPQFNMTTEKLERLNTYNNVKKIKIICVETGIVYNSLTEAAKELNISKGNISGVLLGKYKQTNGFSFRKI